MFEVYAKIYSPNLKRTSPEEMEDIGEEGLKSFKVKPRQVDRLYYIQRGQHYSKKWQIKCRMIDEHGDIYFVSQEALCITRKDDHCYCCCDLMVALEFTKSPQFFASNMASEVKDISLLLWVDGYAVNPPNIMNNLLKKHKTNPPSLEHLCHETIYDNEKKLRHYRDQLPKLLVDTVSDYLQAKSWKIAGSTKYMVYVYMDVLDHFELDFMSHHKFYKVEES